MIFNDNNWNEFKFIINFLFSSFMPEKCLRIFNVFNLYQIIAPSLKKVSRIFFSTSNNNFLYVLSTVHLKRIKHEGSCINNRDSGDNL